jgi:hypothetical protein
LLLYEPCRARSFNPDHLFDQRVRVGHLVEGTCARLLLTGAFSERLAIPVFEVMDELSDDLLRLRGIHGETGENASHLIAPIRHVRGP